MQFHEHKLLFTRYQELLKIPNHNDKHKVIQGIAHALTRRVSQQARQASQNTLVYCQNEVNWCNARRPYYDVWPSVIEPFLKLDLETVKCKHIILPLPQLLIRFPHKHELVGKVRTILVATCMSAEGEPALNVSVDDGSAAGRDQFPIPTIVGMSLKPEESIQERLEYGRTHPYCADVIDTTMVDAAFRFVTVLCLIKNDPDLIEPQVLAADQQRYEQQSDPTLIAKAERKGKRGWSVGRHIEVAPGYRRPHFAIRWCGPGGVEPKLRPIKGCIVKRKLITDVPTGYLDPPKLIQEILA